MSFPSAEFQLRRLLAEGNGKPCTLLDPQFAVKKARRLWAGLFLQMA